MARISSIVTANRPWSTARALAPRIRYWAARGPAPQARKIPIQQKAAAGDRLEPPLTVEQVRADYRSDARTWALLQSVRRADRAWQHRVRRRTYPFLLPARIDR